MSGNCAFLRAWAADWRGADMKAVVSQTLFTAMATTHGPERERLRADYDTNGWPQTAQRRAARDPQGLRVSHRGRPALARRRPLRDRDPRRRGLAFAGPAVNSIYPRWWEPETTGSNRPAGGDEKLGDFHDSFGHPLTVLAVANPLLSFRAGVLDAERDKAAGLGIVRFDKRKRTITIECWPFLADVTRPGTQFPGWPVTVSMLDNYARRPAAWLPLLRVRGCRSPRRPGHRGTLGRGRLHAADRRARASGPMSSDGNYTVRVSEPETGRLTELRGLTALKRQEGTLKVDLSKPDGLR